MDLQNPENPNTRRSAEYEVHINVARLPTAGALNVWDLVGLPELGALRLAEVARTQRDAAFSFFSTGVISSEQSDRPYRETL